MKTSPTAPMFAASRSMIIGLILLPVATALAVLNFVARNSEWRDLSREAELIAAHRPLIETRNATALAIDRLEAIAHLDLLENRHSEAFDLALSDFERSFSDFQERLARAVDSHMGDEGLIEGLQHAVHRFRAEQGEIKEPHELMEASWRFFSTVGWPTMEPATGRWNSIGAMVNKLSSSGGLAFDHFDAVAAQLLDEEALQALPSPTAAWIRSHKARNLLEATSTEGRSAEQRATLRIIGETFNLAAVARFSQEIADDVKALITTSEGAGHIRATNPFLLGLVDSLEEPPEELLERLSIFETQLQTATERSQTLFQQVIETDLETTKRRRQFGLATLGIPALLALALLLYAEMRRRTNLQVLKDAADHDPLTGLPNRFALQHRAQRLIEHPSSQEDGARASLLLIDLDSFKAINDAFGHHVGDSVLVEFARRISLLTAETDEAFRLGGDEFVVLCVGPNCKPQPCTTAQKIRETLSEPICVDDHRLQIAVSCGASTRYLPTPLSDLLIEADLALHEVKELGKRGYLHYDETRRGPLIRRLPALLERDGLEFSFQPQANLLTGEIVGLEGLCRWPQEPGTASFAAIDVVDSIEWLGLIDRFLKNLLVRFEEAHALVGEDFSGRYWLNVWPSQLEALDLEHSLLSTLAGSSLPMDRLGIEITEKRTIINSERFKESAKALREKGVAVALDDFGVFNASIERLTEVPLDVIKIDQRLIRGISQKSELRLFVKALREICDTRNLEMTAEGVEDAADLATLRDLAINHAQGFLVGAALAPAELPSFLDGWDAEAFLQAVAEGITVSHDRPSSETLNAPRAGNDAELEFASKEDTTKYRPLGSLHD